MTRFLTPLLTLTVLGLCHRAAAERTPPNVLMIVSDDLTACLGSYENDVCQTPHLDRLAREGVRFERAYSQYPVCGPSRASFMSGLYPHTTRMLSNSNRLGSFKVSNPRLADHPSIGEFLRENGYVSARISKIYHMGVPGGIEAGSPGGDEPASWDWTYNVIGPEMFSLGEFELLSPIRHHYGSNFSRIVVPDEAAASQADALAAAQAVAFLETRAGRSIDRSDGEHRIKAGNPFFLAVGFVRPHVPLIAPRRIFDQYAGADTSPPFVPEGDLDDVPEPAAAMENMGRYGMNEEQQRLAIEAYYASVTFMDEQVGRLLDALDRLDLRRDTIVIFLSDHGYTLGEHNCWQKVSLFEESVRVPLIISVPGYEQNAGEAATGIVELVDLYPTLADLTGLGGKAPANLHGQSLRPLLEQPRRADWPKAFAYTVTRLNGESIRTEHWRYNNWGDAGEELYDQQADPQEFTNLAKSPAHTEVLAEMRATWQAVHQRAIRDADG